MIMLPTLALLIGIGFFANHQLTRTVVSNAHTVAASYSGKVMAELGVALTSDVEAARSLSFDLSRRGNINISNPEGSFLSLFGQKLSQGGRHSAYWIFLESMESPTSGNSQTVRMAYSVAINRTTGELIAGYRSIASDQYLKAFVRAMGSNQESVLEPHLQEYNPATKKWVVSITSPVTLGNLRGVVGIDIPVDQLQATIEQVRPYPSTVAQIVTPSGTIAAHTNPLLIGLKHYEVNPDIEIRHDLSDKLAKSLPYSFTWHSGGNRYLNIITPARVGTTSNVWMLMLSIPESEILAEAYGMQLTLLVSAVLILLVIAALTIRASREVSLPLSRISGIIRSLAQGDIQHTLLSDAAAGEELNGITQALSQHIEGLNQTERFARDIGKGNLSTEFKLHGEKDVLGMALIEMQSSLINAKKIETERKDEEQKQNWTAQGIAIFSDILRRNNDNMEELSYSIIQKMVEYTDSLLGGVFIVNEREQGGRIATLSMTASYAYDRRKYIDRTVEAGEGVIGRCYREAKTIVMTNIPEEYIKVTSGLGESAPRCLIVVPLMANNQVMGVMEIASLKRYERHQVEFIERIAESIGSTLQSAGVNIRTSALLAKSQSQAEEMIAQEEEMRQNMEELQATQEDMERKRIEQEMLQEELKKEQALLAALLTSIPDYVYFKDTQSRFMRVSNSMVSLFKGFSSPDQLIGKSDFDFHTRENAQSRFDDEKQIMNGTKPPMVNVIAHEVFSDGQEQWVSTIKMPLYDRDGQVIGIWGISKLITEIKRAELEAQAKQQEAAELAGKLEWENMLFNVLMDSIRSMITFKDTQGRYIRVNKAKAKALNLSNQAEVVGKTDFDVFGTEQFRKALEEEKHLIQSGKHQVDREELIKFEDGTKTWGLTDRIPLKTKDDRIAGILTITQDITKLKNCQFDAVTTSRLLERIAMELPVVKYTINKKGVIESAFGMGLDSMGMQDANLVGKDISSIFPKASELLDKSTDEQGYSFTQTGQGWTMKHHVFRNSSTEGGFFGVGIIIRKGDNILKT